METVIEQSPIQEPPVKQTFKELLTGRCSDEFIASISALGFTSPTDVQHAVIPVATESRDVLVQAKTGSGKTLAFIIPLLIRLEQLKAENTSITLPYSLIVTPTRELAIQITDVIRSVTKGAIEPNCIIGGASMDAQKKRLRQDPLIVVGTPGRLLDLIRQKELNLKECRYFVLDEVDEMLSIGFIDDVRAILSRLPDERQGLFVSATISPRVEMLAQNFLEKPEMIILGTNSKDLPPVEHMYFECGSEMMSKPAVLSDVIETLRPASAIVFCNTKSDTELVEVFLRRRGFDARKINSDLSQRQRTKVMQKIKNKELQFLIATDIAARGLDIESLDLVVNFAIHDQAESYVHRSGRTGRAGRAGKTISLVSPRDFASFHQLTKLTNFEFKKMSLPTDQEVADARTAHIYEILREQHHELKERDMLVSRKLLADGGITEPSEDLETIVAKLCRSVVEHAVAASVKSLDAEMAEAEPEGDGPKGNQRNERRGRDGGRDRGERRRDDRRDDNRRDDSRREEPRRGDNRRDNRRAGVEGQEDWQERTPADPTDEYQSQPRKEEDPFTRMYLGQGKKHGLNQQVLTSLLGEFAEIPENDIYSVTMREHYGFFDVRLTSAKKIMEAMGSFDYDSRPLALEIATVFHSRDQEGGGRRGSGGHGRGRHGGGGRGGDRRGGGRGRRRQGGGGDRGGRGGGGPRRNDY
jgi:ATP-dependent RNA helicase DeaD